MAETFVVTSTIRMDGPRSASITIIIRTVQIVTVVLVFLLP